MYRIERRILSEINEAYDKLETPEHWGHCRLWQISHSVSDGDHQPPPQTESGIPFLVISNISNGYINMEKTRHVPEEYFESLGDARKALNDDILFSVAGSYGIVIVVKDVPKFCFQRHIALIKPNRELVDPNYLAVVLKSPYIKGLCDKVATGIAQKTVGIKTLQNIIIPMPPIEEQRDIASRIIEVEPLLDDYRGTEKKYEEINSRFPGDLRDAILQAAMQGKLTEQLESDEDAHTLYNKISVIKQNEIKQKRAKAEKKLKPVEDTDTPFDIPNNWTWVYLQNVVNIRSASRVHKSDWKNNGKPFYRAREIVKLAQNGFVENELYIDNELYNSFAKHSGTPQPGDLMVSGVGTLGATYVVKDGDEFYYKDASVLCFENRYGMNAYFLKYLMESPCMTSQIYDKRAYGTTVATLTMDRAYGFLIPLPPIEEQQRIVKILDDILPDCDDLASMKFTF